MNKISSLNDKQKLFCEHYLISFNATQAAIKAGYSKNSAYSQAHDLLKKPEIQKYLQSKKERIAAKLEITQERTMQEIGRIAFSDIRKILTARNTIIPIASLDDDTAAALSSLQVDELYAGSEGQKYWVGQSKKIRMYDKTKALEMLAKHFGIYQEQGPVSLSVKIGYGKEE